MLLCTAMNLVKFSCGCVGLDSEPTAFVLIPCDADRCDPYVNPGWRDMSDKTSEPLDQSETTDLLEEVANLVDDGNKLRQVQQLLR